MPISDHTASIEGNMQAVISNNVSGVEDDVQTLMHIALSDRPVQYQEGFMAAVTALTSLLSFSTEHRANLLGQQRAGEAADSSPQPSASV